MSVYYQDVDLLFLSIYSFFQIWRKDNDGQYRHFFHMLNSQTPPQPLSS